MFLDGVLYLCKLHNEVNTRISGSKTEDPLFPKKIWPSEGMQDEDILACLEEFYSEENLSSGASRFNLKNFNQAFVSEFVLAETQEEAVALNYKGGAWKDEL